MSNKHPTIQTTRKICWAEIPYFLAVSRTGSLRTAAAELGVNHATVNRQIKQLEANYDVRLFDRTSKGLVLTEAGESLLEKAEVAEKAVIAAQRKVTGLDQKAEGCVHLTVSPWMAYYFLAAEMPLLKKIYPNIDLRLTITESILNLSNTDADISIRGTWSVDDDVIGRKLFDYYSAILVSRQYLQEYWHHRGPDGEGLQWIGQSTLWSNPEWEKLTLFPNAQRIHDIKDPIMIHEMLIRNQGMCIMPFSILLHHPELTIVPGTPILKDRATWLLLHSDLNKTARVRAVVDFLAEKLQQFNERSETLRLSLVAQNG